MAKVEKVINIVICSFIAICLCMLMIGVSHVDLSVLRKSSTERLQEAFPDDSIHISDETADKMYLLYLFHKDQYKSYKDLMEDYSYQEVVPLNIKRTIDNIKHKGKAENPTWDLKFIDSHLDNDREMNGLSYMFYYDSKNTGLLLSFYYDNHSNKLVELIVNGKYTNETKKYMTIFINWFDKLDKSTVTDIIDDSYDKIVSYHDTKYYTHMISHQMSYSVIGFYIIFDNRVLEGISL